MELSEILYNKAEYIETVRGRFMFLLQVMYMEQTPLYWERFANKARRLAVITVSLCTVWMSVIGNDFIFFYLAEHLCNAEEVLRYIYIYNTIINNLLIHPVLNLCLSNEMLRTSHMSRPWGRGVLHNGTLLAANMVFILIFVLAHYSNSMLFVHSNLTKQCLTKLLKIPNLFN